MDGYIDKVSVGYCKIFAQCVLDEAGNLGWIFSISRPSLDGIPITELEADIFSVCHCRPNDTKEMYLEDLVM